MKKRFISFFTALSMVLMLFTTTAVTSFTAYAADVDLAIISNSDIPVSELATATQAKITFNITKVVNDAYATLTAYVNGASWIQETYATTTQYNAGAGESWQANHEVTATGQRVVTFAFAPATWGYQVGIKTDNADGFDAELVKVEFLDSSGNVVKAYDPTAPVINKTNFTYSTLNNTSMEIGDSFTIAYNAANTPPGAKYSFKYKVPNASGSEVYYTPVLDNAVNGTDGQEATGLKVTSSTAGDITTYTFTAIAASAAEFELNIEVSASGTWSDTAYLWFGSATAYKVVAPAAPSYNLTPSNKEIEIGDYQIFTLEGYDGQEPPTWEIDETYVDIITTGVDVDNNQCKLIGKAATDPTTVLTAKLNGKPVGTAVITVVEAYIPPHRHSLVKHDAVKETCTAGGNRAYWTCSGCNKMFSDESGTTEIDEIPTTSALGHNVPAIITQGDTSHYYLCTLCHTKFGEEPHSENNGIVKVQPTETAGGKRQYYCKVCDKLLRDEDIPALGEGHVHEYAIKNYNRDKHWNECVCGQKYDIASHTNSLKDGTLLEATCIADGWKCIITYCTDCGAEISKNVESVPKTGVHTFVNGVCTVCGTTDPTYVPPHTHHTFVNGICTVCGAAESVHTHVYGTEWKYSSLKHWHECVCGDKSEEAFHLHDSGTVTKQPTANETGTRTYYCTVCGAFLFDETIPATGTIPSPVIPYIPPSGTTTPATAISKEPYLQNGSGKMGWDVISDNIINSSEGETVWVNMNGTAELPKNIVSDIAGKDVDLALNMGGGFVWTINGMNVTKAKTVNMKVRKISKIPETVVQDSFGDTESVQIDLLHNGDFGFTAELTIDLGNRYSGMYANSYCYKSRNFEFGDSSEIVNGQAKLRFSHASSWLITVENSPVLEDVSTGAAAHSSGTPIDMTNSTSGGITIPEFNEEKKPRLSNKKRRYRILKKRKLDDVLFVL